MNSIESTYFQVEWKLLRKPRCQLESQRPIAAPSSNSPPSSQLFARLIFCSNIPAQDNKCGDSCQPPTEGISSPISRLAARSRKNRHTAGAAAGEDSIRTPRPVRAWPTIWARKQGFCALQTTLLVLWVSRCCYKVQERKGETYHHFWSNFESVRDYGRKLEGKGKTVSE